MVTAPPPVALHVTRWKTLFAAGGCGALLVGDLLFYFVWPTPETTPYRWEYQEPAKSLVFLGVLLATTTALLLALYWTLTPLPLLRLSASEVIYRPFPLPSRTIRWEEVEQVFASVTRRPVGLWRSRAILTLRFSLKSPRFEARTVQRLLRLDITPGQLSLQPDELVALVQTFHNVQWLPADAGATVAARHGKGRNRAPYAP
jgi:hypothetical protein